MTIYTRNGKLNLLPDNYVFPSMTLQSLIFMWFCGDWPNSIPPYKLLRYWDKSSIKNGRQKLSMMKKVIEQVVRGATIVNMQALVNPNMREENCLELYTRIKHLFWFPSTEKKARRYQSMSWKSFYNILAKRKWRLYGESLSEQEGQTVQPQSTARPEQRTTTNQNEALSSSQSRKRKRGTSSDAADSQGNSRGKNRPKQRRNIHNKGGQTFFDSIAKGKSPEQQTADQERRARILASVIHECCLKDRCQNGAIPGYQTCHGKGCHRQIHHLCALHYKLTSNDNELNVYCSEGCKKTVE